ncbi:NUDIX domain-containing protein [Candidatus Woesearchaeota archaeon]|jgi:8-oxo-dGTP pyrophosphatase MutT (NUDIX family)|nr:NUDIX domain-containing protein [Candidatus Woesearchaeota archaeon]
MKKYRRGIFAVVYRIKNNKIEYLILKRKLHWKGFEFPKGGLKFLEPKILGVKREVKEETGLKILKIKKYNVLGFYDYNKKLKDRKNMIGQEFSLYSVMVEDGEVKLDNLEHESYEWCDFKKALKKLTWENQKQCLIILNEELTKN